MALPLFAFASCSSEDDGETQAAVEAEITGYCERAASVQSLATVFDPAAVDPLDQDALRTAFEDLRGRMAAVGEVIPEEIAEPFGVVSAQIDAVFGMIEEADYDFAKLAERQDEFTALIENDEVDAAQQLIAAFDAENCDQTLVTKAIENETASPQDVSAVEAEITESFDEAEIAAALAITGEPDLTSLAAKIVSGEIDTAELDQAMQLRSDGIAILRGDDPAFDVLLTACEGGDFESCDGLFGAATAGSEYQRIAATCAGKASTPIGGTCVERFGSGTTTTAQPEVEVDTTVAAGG